jgi:hypothetical protein
LKCTPVSSRFPAYPSSGQPSLTLDSIGSFFTLQIKTLPGQAVILDNLENIGQERLQKPFQLFEKMVGARGFAEHIPVLRPSGHRYAMSKNAPGLFVNL